eukprot:jgi/Bigna1/91634/estExt_fgenesh1_pg.C_1100004
MIYQNTVYLLNIRLICVSRALIAVFRAQSVAGLSLTKFHPYLFAPSSIQKLFALLCARSASSRKLLTMISKKVVRRFSLLLLGEGEYYFQVMIMAFITDYGGYLFLSEAYHRDNSSGEGENREEEDYTLISDRKRIKGRFHIGSASVLFEPDDMRYPVYRIPYTETTGPRLHNAPSEKRRSRSIYILLNTKLVIEMKENNTDHPYRFRRKKSEFAFALTYANLEEVNEKIKLLHDLAEKDRSQREAELAKLILKREGQAVLASQITPLVESPGRMMLTDKRLYVQHFNNVSAEPLDKYELSLIQFMHKRRYAMRDRGIEFIFRQSTKSHHHRSSLMGSPRGLSSSSSSTMIGGGKNASFLQSNSLYLSFKDQKTRDETYDLIIKQSSVNISTATSLDSVRKAWHEGKVSNYEYLLHLNHAAGRSFNDVTQYPVFPWVLKDFTSRRLDLNDPKVFRDLSKPIGALETNRLRTFRKRMREMPAEMSHGKPFLYGTHYSAPGYVLYFLVRKAPEYMLRLQSGHFDVPDRLFHSMHHAWQSVLTSNTDVKELIPEFYNVDTKGDFALNTKNLDLGVRQDGSEVDDLILPKWARTARQFVTKMREALECKHVSDNIHKWIDLIFGYKQTGDEAVKADNLFYPLTYEGAVDIETVKDATKRASIEVITNNQYLTYVFKAQIREFGQTPRQIFRDPHPARSDNPSTHVSMRLGRRGRGGNTAEGEEHSSLLGSNGSSSGRVMRDSKRGDIIQENDKLETKRATIHHKRRQQQSSRNNTDDVDTSSTAPIQSAMTRGRGGASKTSTVTTPSMLHADQEKNPYCKRWHSFSSISPAVRRLRGHRRKITDVCVDNSGQIVCSVAMDATLKVHGLADGKQRRSYKVNRRNLSLALSSCTISPADANTIVMGSWDNSVYIYSISQGAIIAEGRAHDDAVSSVALTENRVVSGSWDGTVKVWDVMMMRAPIINNKATMATTHQGSNNMQQQPVLELDEHDHPVMCVCTDPTARVACSASQDGMVLVWDLRTGKRSQRKIKAHKREVTSLSLSNTGYDVTTVCFDGHIRTFDLTKGECFSDISTKERLTSVETDGDVVWAAGDKGVVKLWEMNEETMLTSDSKKNKQQQMNHKAPVLSTEELHGKISSFSLSRDGLWLVAGVESEEGEDDMVIFKTK